MGGVVAEMKLPSVCSDVSCRNPSPVAARRWAAGWCPRWISSRHHPMSSVRCPPHSTSSLSVGRTCSAKCSPDCSAPARFWLIVHPFAGAAATPHIALRLMTCWSSVRPSVVHPTYDSPAMACHDIIPENTRHPFDGHCHLRTVGCSAQILGFQMNWAPDRLYVLA